MTAPLASALQTVQSSVSYGGAVSQKGLRAALFLVIRDERRQDGQTEISTSADRDVVARLRSDLLASHVLDEPARRVRLQFLAHVVSLGATLAAARAVDPPIPERTAHQWVADFFEDAASRIEAEHVAKRNSQIRAVDRAVQKVEAERDAIDRQISGFYKTMCAFICGRSSHGGGDLEGQGAGCGHCPKRYAVRE